MDVDERKSRNGEIIVVIEEDLQELIPGYLENRRKDVAAIVAALEQGDFETIRSLGHMMKGSGGGYGFDEITEIGRACEDAAKRSQAREVRDQVDRLTVYLDHVVVVYEP